MYIRVDDSDTIMIEKTAMPQPFKRLDDNIYMKPITHDNLVKFVSTITTTYSKIEAIKFVRMLFNCLLTEAVKIVEDILTNHPYGEVAHDE